ncbi:hypothetical protein Bca52824_056169 [Brassica carinata]|uniref:Uncharacterized protein n=1 Tax=Brassica carinata TaxID=52824 RepID=A0A8X7UCI5_BRACI|nr:hypothetical protein Bca52824_056169 [Brassica carinata]
MQWERVLARRKVDSRLEAYELDQNIPLMDPKTIDDRVNALLEERLKDLGIWKIPENHDNPSPPLLDNSLSMASTVVQTHQKSVNSPALVAATPGKEFGPKKNLAKELEKESGVKRTLDEEFGSVDKATDMRPLDFIVVSPATATKDDKATKDYKAAKDPAYGRGYRRKHIVKGEEADEKKKSGQADATCKVQPDVEDSSLADITDEVVAEQNEFAPESDVENSEVALSFVEQRPGCTSCECVGELARKTSDCVVT